MGRQNRRAMRREQIERWLASEGMTVEEWCKLNGMATSTFYLWLGKFRDEEPEVFGPRPAKGWVEIARRSRRDSMALAVAAAPRGDAGARTATCGGAHARSITVDVGGAVVTIPAGSDADDVANVVRAVMGR